jgi:hypothetical protein
VAPDATTAAAAPAKKYHVVNVAPTDSQDGVMMITDETGAEVSPADLAKITGVTGYGASGWVNEDDLNRRVADQQASAAATPAVPSGAGA